MSQEGCGREQSWPNEVLLWHLLGGTQVNHEESQSKARSKYIKTESVKGKILYLQV
jgi:hypothetical protein